MQLQIISQYCSEATLVKGTFLEIKTSLLPISPEHYYPQTKNWENSPLSPSIP